ncbi:MAG: MgtC/SapB family protein [Gemmatimonadota bacterium]
MPDPTTWTFLTQILAAFALSLPTALERERATRTLGLRTFPLVSVASCGYVLLAIEVMGAHPDGQSRILAGLMTGMGFIGGGAILKQGDGVRGTATAASLWTMGVVGAAVAYERYGIAIVISLINFLTLGILTRVERRFGKRDAHLGDS